MTTTPNAPVTKVQMTSAEFLDRAKAQAKEMFDEEFAERLEEETKKLWKKWEAQTESEKKKSYDNAFRDAVAKSNGKAQLPGAMKALKEGMELRGVNFAEFAIAMVKTNNNLEAAKSYAEKSNFRDATINQFEKLINGEVEKDGLLGSADATGGVTIPTVLSTDFVTFLFDKVVVRKLGARTLEMENGNLDLGRMTGTATAYWMQEGANITVSNETFDKIQFSAKNMGIIVPISNKLLRRSSLPGGVEALIQEDMFGVAAVTEDAAFLRSDGSGNSPTGIAHLMSAGNKFNVTNNSPSATAQQINSVLYSMMARVMTKNAPGLSYGWAWSTRDYLFLQSLFSANGVPIYPEMMDGRLRGYQAEHTNAIPTNLGVSGQQSEAFFGDFAQSLIAETNNLSFDTSDSASFVNGAGDPVSSFTTDRKLLRLIHEVDHQLRYPDAFSMGEQIEWGADLL